MPSTVVLVEGASDKEAVQALARRMSRDLRREGVEVLAMGGASRFGENLVALTNTGIRPLGLCDAGEIDDLRRGLALAGMDGADPRLHGFFVCEPDLESELIRAVGAEGVIEVLTREGDLRAFRSMQNQPAWRNRPVDGQLRRWIGAGAGRKIRYGRLLAEAARLDRVPRALSDLIAAI